MRTLSSSSSAKVNWKLDSLYQFFKAAFDSPFICRSRFTILFSFSLAIPFSELRFFASLERAIQILQKLRLFYNHTTCDETLKLYYEICYKLILRTFTVIRMLSDLVSDWALSRERRPQFMCLSMQFLDEFRRRIHVLLGSFFESLREIFIESEFNQLMAWRFIQTECEIFFNTRI